MSETLPTSERPTAPAVVVAPTYKDPITGALYVHSDLQMCQGPWEEETHVGPIRCTERFGDVESWVAYVRRFCVPDEHQPLLTWNRCGLRAVLDYHAGEDAPGRCQWTAEYPFETSIQWRAWMGLASGQAVGQKAAVERLEELAEDIVEPPAADLAQLLRTLRATVKATADAELRPDGTTAVAFSQDARVKSADSVELPSSFTIAIPVLRGHVDQEGRPVLYRLQVRVRASVDESAKLTLRFTIPTAERVLEAVYEDRVNAARELLGESYSLLRAAG